MRTDLITLVGLSPLSMADLIKILPEQACFCADLAGLWSGSASDQIIFGRVETGIRSFLFS